MPEQATPFASWAIVEMLGHKRLAGHVTEQEIAGAKMLRVDVPATPEDADAWGTYPATQEYSKLIGVGSIYCLTPCTEEVARRAAREIERHNDPLPVSLPTQRQLRAPETDRDDLEEAELFDGREDDDSPA